MVGSQDVWHVVVETAVGGNCQGHHGWTVCQTNCYLRIRYRDVPPNLDGVYREIVVQPLESLLMPFA